MYVRARGHGCVEWNRTENKWLVAGSTVAAAANAFLLYSHYSESDSDSESSKSDSESGLALKSFKILRASSVS